MTAPRSQPIQVGALAGLDPGRSKCGLVRTDVACQNIVEASVLAPEACFEWLQRWRQQGLISAVVMGDGTGSKAWQARLADLLPLHTLCEAGSTLEARRRYWELEPARGWRRLLPEGLRQPPRDWDDVVAQLLVERWLGHTLTRRPSR
ncbi:MAG: resolvase [Cyanobacteriota bacterium]|nr:resolvase [Cyanobacteriota bacterium]